MIDIELFGTDAAAFHLTNLRIHTANSILLYLFLKLATGAVWRSAFVAALFAVHPLHVESVAWIAERKDVLSTFFGMLTLLAYLRYTRKPERLRRYLIVTAIFPVGLMAKPMLVTLPFVLLLLDYLATATHSPVAGIPSVSWRRLVLEKIPFLNLRKV